MFTSKRQKEVNYERFEEDLLQVLKNDIEHRIPFGRKFAFKSRRYNCLLSAADIRLDSATGQFVMVGAFKSGQSNIDISKDSTETKIEIEIFLRECYEDIQLSSAMEDLFGDKIKNAVISNYVTRYLDKLEKQGMLNNGCVVFENFAIEEFKINRSTVMELRREGSDIIITRGNSFNPRYDAKISKLSLCEIQFLGEKLKQICEQ